MPQVFLSYPMEQGMPVYGGHAQFKVSAVKSLDRGDSANVFSLLFENHWGTHIDAPNHFFKAGQSIADYPADFFIFSSPQVIDVELDEAEILTGGAWLSTVLPETDLILLRSGWGRFRAEEKYVIRNPGLAPELGLSLRSLHPSVRAVGMDWISVSSFANREVGCAAHCAFLDPSREGQPVLLIEDMLLPEGIVKFEKIVAAPLRVRGIDSAPCTVIGYGYA